MPVKRCSVCNKPAYRTDSIGIKNKTWICPNCEQRFLNSINSASEDVSPGNICIKCIRKSKNQCRFTAFERQQITACSDWEGKDTERNKKRWAKFEQ